MPISTRSSRLLPAAICLIIPAISAAWTPYGHGPYAPASEGGKQASPGASPPSESAPPASVYPPEGFGGPMGAPYGMPESPFGATPPDFPAPPFGFPGFGAPPGFPEGFPGGGPGGFGSPGGLRISQDASEEAYGLTIELDEGMDPAAIQVRPEGRSLMISRERSEQRVQEDSFDDGHGFARSFSYSSGSARRRLPVPRDADLGAMTREDAASSIRISIPRHQMADPAQPGSR